MSDPATKTDLNELEERLGSRMDQIEQRTRALALAAEETQREGMEGFRQQQSAEHGSMYSMLVSIRDAVHWLKSKWHRFGIDKTWPGDPK